MNSSQVSHLSAQRAGRPEFPDRSSKHSDDFLFVGHGLPIMLRRLARLVRHFWCVFTGNGPAAGREI
jgi:hypothetical protein